MTTTAKIEQNFFPIESYDPRFKGYYLDVMGVLWSNKSGGYCEISKSRSKLNDHSVNIHRLISNIESTQAWRDFVSRVKAKVEKTVPVSVTTCVVALLDENGVPKFSSEPKVHASEKTAREEVERLTLAFPGKRFAYFKCEGVAVATGVSWS